MEVASLPSNSLGWAHRKGCRHQRHLKRWHWDVMLSDRFSYWTTNGRWLCPVGIPQAALYKVVETSEDKHVDVGQSSCLMRLPKQFSVFAPSPVRLVFKKVDCISNIVQRNIYDCHSILLLLLCSLARWLALVLCLMFSDFISPLRWTIPPLLFLVKVLYT